MPGVVGPMVGVGSFAAGGVVAHRFPGDEIISKKQTDTFYAAY